MVEEPLIVVWVTFLLVFLYRIKPFKVSHASLELFEHSVNFLWKLLFLARHRAVVKLLSKPVL